MSISADISSNPFKITGTTSSSEVVTTARVRIQGFLWVGATTNGHLLSITDVAGNQLWKAQMVTRILNEGIFIPFPLGLRSVDGIHINDMDSGEVYIYVA